MLNRTRCTTCYNSNLMLLRNNAVSNRLATAKYGYITMSKHERTSK
uniref:Uncharacterized protein n=1 Tax=Arundo donax TaxID=35708 RepID=A0A0A9CCX1_ARUDO